MITKSESTREWKRRNPELVRAQNARYREKYREEIAARSKARYESDPEPRREATKRWTLNNLDRVNTYQREYYHENKDRKGEQRRAWVEQNPDYAREVQRWHRGERARVITPRAINGRTPWTEAELRIALDPSLSLAEAALMLGRTVNAVGQKRHMVRRATS